jgi:transcriptional regulator with XRE-family HTH domain
MKETAAIGKVIKARRIAAGLTLDDLADVISVQRPEMWRKEKGTSQFTVEQLAAIAKRLGTFPEVICKEARQGGDVDSDRAELDAILSDAPPDSIRNLLAFLKSTPRTRRAK